MKRLLGLALVLGVLFSLGGCVYGPGYYQRPGVVYDDAGAAYSDTAAGGYDYDDGWYSPGYYYGNAYGPWCCYGGVYPWIGLGFYGGYYHGYHGGYHGGWHGGGHWGGGHSGGHSSGGHGGGHH